MIGYPAVRYAAGDHIQIAARAVGSPERPTVAQPEEEASMTVASDLLQQHIQTLVADNARWQTLIADDLVWELPYGPGSGDPARRGVPGLRRPRRMARSARAGLRRIQRGSGIACGGKGAG